MKTTITLILAGLLFLAGICTVSAGDALQININTATAEELARLNGVGPTHAAGIIAFRQKNGPFKNPEELMQVTGIGPRTIEKNKGLIVVEHPAKKLTHE
jgi:competence protein ComEA